MEERLAELQIELKMLKHKNMFDRGYERAAQQKLTRNQFEQPKLLKPDTDKAFFAGMRFYVHEQEVKDGSEE
jgi:hypothetical protein